MGYWPETGDIQDMGKVTGRSGGKPEKYDWGTIICFGDSDAEAFIDLRRGPKVGEPLPEGGKPPEVKCE